FGSASASPVTFAAAARASARSGMRAMATNIQSKCTRCELAFRGIWTQRPVPMRAPGLLRTSIALALLTGEARAQEDPFEPGDDHHEGFTLPPGAVDAPPLSIMGYIDVGFARAGGNGSSFVTGDQRPEPDYMSDPFAPAV